MLLFFNLFWLRNKMHYSQFFIIPGACSLNNWGVVQVKTVRKEKGIKGRQIGKKK